MRRVLVLLVFGAFAAGCHHEAATPAAGAQQYVDQIGSATDPKEIGDLCQKLYSCGPAALTPIATSLDDFNYKAKPQLVAVASAIPDPKAVAIVHKQLHNHDPRTRAMACYGLTLNPSAPVIDVTALLRRNDESDQEWAIYALSKSKLPVRESVLRNAAKSSNAHIRALAARGFGTLPGKQSIDLTTPLLNDKDPIVASEAFITLARLDPSNPLVKKRFDEAATRLKSATGEDKEGLILLLGATHLPAAEPFLSKLLGDGDPRIRVVAARAYAGMGKAAEPDRLIKSLKSDPDISVRREIGRTIGKLKIVGFGMQLFKLIMNADPQTAKIALDALLECAQPDCFPPFWYIAQRNRNYRFKREASIALCNAAIGLPQALPGIDQIVHAADSRDPNDRAEAAWLLGHLHGPRFYVKLNAMMNDADPDVRAAAMSALKYQIGMSQAAPKVTDHPMPSWLEESD